MNTVTVNGEPHEVPPGTTLARLIQSLGHVPDEVATAVNGDFVPRPARDAHVLQPGARVTCFKAIVGG